MSQTTSSPQCPCCPPPTHPIAAHILGEVLGTFLMCFFGIGAVATATLFGAHTGAFQVGLIWGIGIAIAIYTTRNLSCAHFNPAVTLAMCLAKRCKWKNFPIYVMSQFVGAMLAALVLWFLFSNSVQASLLSQGLSMSEPSLASSIWLEPFPNTSKGIFTPQVAAFAEGFGVFLLIIIIFSLTEGCNLGRPSDDIFPLFIGFTVSAIIATVGPITDAGLNPARDFGPRIIGALVGFGNFAFSWPIFMVYVVAPLIGAALAALIFVKVIEPLQQKKNTCC